MSTLAVTDVNQTGKKTDISRHHVGPVENNPRPSDHRSTTALRGLRGPLIVPPLCGYNSVYRTAEVIFPSLAVLADITLYPLNNFLIPF